MTKLSLNFENLGTELGKLMIKRLRTFSWHVKFGIVFEFGLPTAWTCQLIKSGGNTFWLGKVHSDVMEVFLDD